MKTFSLSLLIFVMVVALGEAVLSQLSIREQLPLQTFGTDFDPLEHYVLMLDVFESEHDGVQCVIIGSSMGRTAIHPDFFSQGFARQSGQPIDCFNVGVSGLTASAAGPLAQYITDNYHPEYVIYATSFIDYDLDRTLYDAEVAFPESNLISYRNGNFNLDGWLLNDYDLYRYLRAVPGIIHEGRIANLRLVYESTAAGFSPRAAYYANRSPTLEYLVPNAYPLEFDESDTFELSTTDVDGLNQILALREQGIKVIIIEMPAYITPQAWELANTDADDTGWYDLTTIIAPHARERGVPFWTTTDLDVVSRTSWNDTVHLFYSEAPAFSIWLGQQLGAASEAGVFEDNPPVELLSAPPLDIVPVDPDPERLTRYGLSEEHLAELEDYRSSFDLVPDGATIFIPEHALLNRDFLQISLGGHIEWYYQFGTNIGRPDEDEIEGRVSDFYDLMTLLIDMQYTEDLTLTEAQQSALDDWRNTKHPADLRASGIEYLFYGETWFSWTSVEGAEALTNPDYYELVAKIWHPAVRMYFYLYHALDEAES
jgi:hypothetical protein